MFPALDIDVFEKNTGVSFYIGDIKGVEKIVSMKEIERILSIEAMSVDYLEKLVRNIGLEGNPECKPYKNCQIKLARMDPWNVKVGQTFVERGKVLSLLENFANFFQGYCITRGAAKCNAYIITGITKDNVKAIAHYVPPIIEENYNSILLDGIHRSFLIKNVGTTSEAVIIKGVKTRFPSIPQEWSCVNVVDAKPLREVRYKELNTKFFRDLKMVGIDG